MRLFLLVLAISLPGLAGSQASTPFDLTTASGTTYQPTGVFRVEPDGITYIYPVGMAKILFADLPEAVQNQYAYDAKKSAAYAAADAKQQAASEKEGDIARQQAFQHDIDIAIQTAKDIAAIPNDPGVGTLDSLKATPADGAGGGHRGRRGARARKLRRE